MKNDRRKFIDQIIRSEDRIDARKTAQDDQSLTNGSISLSLANISLQELRRPNETDSPNRLYTTSDLLCWSFQVTRGMQYLESRNVLHGDLAARNILLCNDNVVKICDFGLARLPDETGYYHKKEDVGLPFRWLALESINDRVFSTYSDVWSFGIVMWELFSLGEVPYSGDYSLCASYLTFSIEHSITLTICWFFLHSELKSQLDIHVKLNDGYRMEKPEYATKDM